MLGDRLARLSVETFAPSRDHRAGATIRAGATDRACGDGHDDGTRAHGSFYLRLRSAIKVRASTVIRRTSSSVASAPPTTVIWISELLIGDGTGAGQRVAAECRAADDHERGVPHARQVLDLSVHDRADAGLGAVDAPKRGQLGLADTE